MKDQLESLNEAVEKEFYSILTGGKGKGDPVDLQSITQWMSERGSALPDGEDFDSKEEYAEYIVNKSLEQFRLYVYEKLESILSESDGFWAFDSVVNKLDELEGFKPEEEECNCEEESDSSYETVAEFDYEDDVYFYDDDLDYESYEDEYPNDEDEYPDDPFPLYIIVT